MRTCENVDCGLEFTPKTHNQIYCTSECCRVATNKRIMSRYYADRARKRGESRWCECGTPLSRYNPTEICQSCSVKRDRQDEEYIIKVLGLIG